MEKDYKKLYEDALETAKAYYKQNKGVVDGVECLSIIFPELKESEDEKIRKWLKEMVELVRKANPDNSDHTEMCSDALAWLEKQGEQNNLAWSEEDETKLRTAQTFIRNTSLIEVDGIKEATIDWLKSLKDRMTITNKNEFDRGYDVGISAAKYNQWKPSDEQMTALRRMKAAIAGEGEIYRPLNSLYEDLNKLLEK